MSLQARSGVHGTRWTRDRSGGNRLTADIAVKDSRSVGKRLAFAGVIGSKLDYFGGCDWRKQASANISRKTANYESFGPVLRRGETVEVSDRKYGFAVGSPVTFDIPTAFDLGEYVLRAEWRSSLGDRQVYVRVECSTGLFAPKRDFLPLVSRLRSLERDGRWPYARGKRDEQADGGRFHATHRKVREQAVNARFPPNCCR